LTQDWRANTIWPGNRICAQPLQATMERFERLRREPPRSHSAQLAGGSVRPSRLSFVSCSRAVGCEAPHFDLSILLLGVGRATSASLFFLSHILIRGARTRKTGGLRSDTTETSLFESENGPHMRNKPPGNASGMIVCETRKTLYGKSRYRRSPDYPATNSRETHFHTRGSSILMTAAKYS